MWIIGVARIGGIIITIPVGHGTPIGVGLTMDTMATITVGMAGVAHGVGVGVIHITAIHITDITGDITIMDIIRAGVDIITGTTDIMQATATGILRA